MILMSECKLPDKRTIIEEIIRLIIDNPLLRMSVRESLSHNAEIDTMIREKVKTQLIEKRAIPNVDIRNNYREIAVTVLAYTDPINITVPFDRFSMSTLMDVLQQLKRDEQLIRKK